MGSVVDVQSFYTNIAKLIGSKGVLQGRIFIFYTAKDGTLNYLFRATKLGSEYPLGIAKLDYHKMATSLKESDPALMNESFTTVLRICRERVININVTNIVFSHLDYRKHTEKLLRMIDINSDDYHYMEGQ